MESCIKTSFSQEQIRSLRHVLDESKRKLDEVVRKKVKAEQDLLKCTTETEQRLNLVMGNHDVIDVLLELRDQMQEEKILNEELSGESHRDLLKNLHDRKEIIINKAKSLNAEIVEVTNQLEEAKAYYQAATAQSAVPQSTSRSKRNHTKPK